jgi:malate dehydrogenase (oxaloacetate-decarboxylating)
LQALSTRCEAAPRDLIEWSEGRALIAAGSPFPDVDYGDRRIRVSQCNNAFIFPGVALGVLATGARRVTDSMFMAAATALAECSPSRDDPNAPLLPSIEDVRQVSRQVAIAVALEAQRKGLAASTTPEQLENAVTAKMWTPRYARVRLKR